MNNTVKRFYTAAGVMFALGIFVIVIVLTACSNTTILTKVAIEPGLSEEDNYKATCYGIWHSTILKGHANQYYDENISVVGKVVDKQKNRSKSVKSFMKNPVMAHAYPNDYTYTYTLSDEGLSDGGGKWIFTSSNKTFENGDMIIIYGSGAMASNEFVLMNNVQYAEMYKE